MIKIVLPTLTTCALGLAIACGGSGDGIREVKITQSDDGCTPKAISASLGEKLKLVITNETDGAYKLAAEEAAQFDEVVVPERKTRSAVFTAPPGEYSLKCYVPGGIVTKIVLNNTRIDD